MHWTRSVTDIIISKDSSILATAIAFAVKVVDVSTERQSEQDAKRLREVIKIAENIIINKDI